MSNQGKPMTPPSVFEINKWVAATPALQLNVHIASKMLSDQYPAIQAVCTHSIEYFRGKAFEIRTYQMTSAQLEALLSNGEEPIILLGAIQRDLERDLIIVRFRYVAELQHAVV